MRITYLGFLWILVLFVACEQHHEPIPDIKIGTQEASLSAVSINKFLERKILLTGGDGRYRVNVEDSKIVQASISQDTLKIKGILEGDTFALITSHDKSALLQISVAPQELLFSHNEIELYPSQELRSVSLSGGSDIIHLQTDDPQGILQVRLNASSGIIELKALYEGEATLHATSVGISPKTLKVKVKAEGQEPTQVGVYQAKSRSIYPVLIPNLVVKRKGVGVWLAAGNYPQGETLDAFHVKTSVFLQMPPKLQEGTYTDVSVELFPYAKNIPLLKEGTTQMYVRKITDNTIEFRGKGYRIIVPKL